MSVADLSEERTDIFEVDDEGTKNFLYKEKAKQSNLEYVKTHNERFLFEKENTYLEENIREEKTSETDKIVNQKSGKYLKLFKAVQKWKGNVTKIQDDGFKARLKDLTKGGTDEEAWFSFKEISEEERKALAVGKSFYLSLGYSEYLGQVEKVSRLHFQKITDWDLGLVEKVNEKVDEYLNLFDD